MGLLPALTKRVKIAIGVGVSTAVLVVIVILVVATGKKIDYNDYDQEPWAQVGYTSAFERCTFVNFPIVYLQFT